MDVFSARASRNGFEKQSKNQGSAQRRPLLWSVPVYLPDNTGEKQLPGELGTAHAIKNRIPSEASDSAKRWGGRRNSALRTSSSLSVSQTANIIAAAQFAAAIGLSFNRMVTIHWEHAGIADCRAAWATGRFLKLAGDWVAVQKLENNQRKSKRAASIAWAWVRENGGGKGSHVHILMHFPADKITAKNGSRVANNTPRKQRARLGNMPRRWLRSITGKPYVAGTIKTERIGGTAGAAQTAPAAYQDNLAAVVGYILKGASPAAARALGLGRLEAGGVIIGKRAATSQNIGWAARKSKFTDDLGKSGG